MNSSLIVFIVFGFVAVDCRGKMEDVMPSFDDLNLPSNASYITLMSLKPIYCGPQIRGLLEHCLDKSNPCEIENYKGVKGFINHVYDTFCDKEEFMQAVMELEQCARKSRSQWTPCEEIIQKSFRNARKRANEKDKLSVVCSLDWDAYFKCSTSVGDKYCPQSSKTVFSPFVKGFNELCPASFNSGGQNSIINHWIVIILLTFVLHTMG